MADYSYDWLQGKLLAWPSPSPVAKIDTHHHFVPDIYAKAVEDAGAGQASYNLARKLNFYAAKLRDEYPNKFGFFANLPSLLDTGAALAEIGYCLDTLQADGVILFTRYGNSNKYLGHPEIEPIWAELSRRKCVVFVHPTHPVDTTKVNSAMPQPMIDYPHETTRAAMDMITMGTRSKYTDCKVILSHAGGTLPYLINRVATPLTKVPGRAAQGAAGISSHSQVMDAFRSFHYDLALSSSPQVIKVLLDLVPHEHILYGSDFPYALAPAYPAFLEQFEDCEMDADIREKIYFRNAQTLFPRLLKERKARERISL